MPPSAIPEILVAERFTYHRLGRDFPTSVDIGAWIQRDERIAAFHAELVQEAGAEAAGWFAGYLLITALSDRLDLYLNTQAKHLAAMRDALNLGGALAGIILRSPEADVSLVRQLEAALAPIGPSSPPAARRDPVAPGGRTCDGDAAVLRAEEQPTT